MVYSFCYFALIAKPNKYIKNSLFETCRIHFNFSRHSMLGTVFKKNNCANLFLEGLYVLIVKELALCLLLNARWSSMVKPNRLSQLSPSWPLQQAETRPATELETRSSVVISFWISFLLSVKRLNLELSWELDAVCLFPHPMGGMFQDKSPAHTNVSVWLVSFELQASTMEAVISFQALLFS